MTRHTHRHRHRRRRRCGFTLTELLFVIVAMVAFAAIAGRLFATTLRLTQASTAAQDAAASFDAATRRLRADAWSAVGEISVNDPTVAAVPLAGGGLATWTIRGSELTRSSGAATDRYALPAGATFAVEHGDLVLVVPTTTPAGDVTIRFARQRDLLKGLTS